MHNPGRSKSTGTSLLLPQLQWRSGGSWLISFPPYITQEAHGTTSLLIAPLPSSAFTAGPTSVTFYQIAWNQHPPNTKKEEKNEYIHTKLVQPCQSVINLSVNCKTPPAVTWMYVACALNVVLVLQSICHPLSVYERWETCYLVEHSQPLCVAPAAKRRLKWIFSRGRRPHAHTNTQAAAPRPTRGSLEYLCC